MAWLLLDLALVLLALVLVVVTGLALYRSVRSLLRRLGDAGEAVGRASEGLEPSAPSVPAGGSRRIP